MEYMTRGVCSRKIEIELEGEVIRSVRFQGGCAGNTQGVAALVVGMTAEEAIRRLGGIRCGFKSTSCPDQLATALRQYRESKSEE
ncbi:MAG: TIGR03905 family TSCPD domain-containing protein [Ruminococcaceae bacterium]|nr:TIGR03905 family TSCPD domain-containing protein [Oscillospiraceae bacterium]